MQIVPEVMDYLDKKKKESYYEEVKTFKANLDVVRECRLEARVAEIQRRCENSLMTLDVVTFLRFCGHWIKRLGALPVPG